MEQVKPEIVKMLGEQGERDKAQALFNELKSKADVKLLLPEKRVQWRPPARPRARERPHHDC